MSDLSSASLFRKARAATSKTEAEKLRKLGAAKRREERNATKSRQRRIKTAHKRVAKQKRQIAAKKAKRVAKVEFEVALGEAAIEKAFNESIGTATEAIENERRIELMNAMAEGHDECSRRTDEMIVCGIIGSYQHNSVHATQYAPWTLSGPEMHALIRELERNGYSVFGRRRRPEDKARFPGTGVENDVNVSGVAAAS